MMRLLVTLCAAGLSSAQVVSVPIAGTILDSDGRLLSIAGVPGNLLPGRTIPGVTGRQPILAAGFSSKMGALKTESQVIVVDGSGVFQSSREAPPGTALFGFATDGNLQWVCFPNAQQLQSVSGGAVIDTSGWGDTVVALGAVSGNSIGALVFIGRQLWAETVATDTGAISSQIPIGGTAPATFFEGGWLTATATGLEWQAASGAGTSLSISIPTVVTTLRNAGTHSVVINGRWLLGADWRILEIPFVPRSRPADSARPPSGRFR